MSCTTAASAAPAALATGLYAAVYTADGITRADMTELTADAFGGGMQLVNLFGKGTSIPCRAGQGADGPTLTIAGGGAVKGFDEDGASYDVYYGYLQGGRVFFNGSDIVLKGDVAEHTLINANGPDTGIAFVNFASGRTYFMNNPCLYLCNGLAEGYLYDNDEEEFGQYSGEVYGRKDGNTLVIIGFAGSDGFLNFTLDEATGTAVARNQTAHTDANGVTYYYSGTDDDGEVSFGEMHAVYEEIGSTLRLTFTDAGWEAVSTSGLRADRGKGTMIVFDFGYGDDGSGIVEVSYENETDAPVEYFNLQGIRMERPTNAGIYIRRQGEGRKVVRF